MLVKARSKRKKTLFLIEIITLHLSDKRHSEKGRLESAFIIVVCMLLLIYICLRLMWCEVLSLMCVSLHLLLLPRVLTDWGSETSLIYWWVAAASKNLMRDTAANLNSERLPTEGPKVRCLRNLIIGTCHYIICLNKLISAPSKKIHSIGLLSNVRQKVLFEGE